MPKFDNANPSRFDIPGVTFTAIASPSRGTKESTMWRATVAPGSDGAVHQVTREELVFALSGEGAVRIEGETHPLAPGDAFAVPPFTDFQIGCRGDTPFEAVFVLPAGGRAIVADRPAFQPPWSV
ncbi:MAG TPA: cupin domain-containing protein [Devosia sp.]|nr:cupin domain-containing protein [Devosia sp.]